MAQPARSTKKAIIEHESYLRHPCGQWLRLDQVKDVMLRYWCPLLHIKDPEERKRFEYEHQIITSKIYWPKRKSPPPPPSDLNHE